MDLVNTEKKNKKQKQTKNTAELRFKLLARGGGENVSIETLSLFKNLSFGPIALIYASVSVFVSLCLCLSVSVSVSLSLSLPLSPRARVCVRACACVRVCMRVSVFVHACVCVCVYVARVESRKPVL